MDTAESGERAVSGISPSAVLQHAGAVGLEKRGKEVSQVYQTQETEDPHVY